jgi:hypothetical protein
MSTVSTTSSAASYAKILAASQHASKTSGQSQPATDGTAASNSATATSVTLSAAAQASLAQRDFATVTADARSNLDTSLANAKLTSPLKDGKLAIDLEKMDRRELFAISTNNGQGFAADEQKAAAIELARRFDAAMAGPTAVGRVTGDVKGLYTAALAYYDAMGPEEKAAANTIDARAAIADGIAQLDRNPGWQATSAADPVADYLDRLASDETGTPRAIIDVANDARTTLDRQYKNGKKADFSDFDSRSLSAVALNTSGKFAADEVLTASRAIRSRAGAALLAGLKAGNSSGDPAAFASNVISLYGAMSTEERAAAGWGEELYASAVANYKTASKLGSLLGAASGLSLFGGSTNTGNNTMSLLTYL